MCGCCNANWIQFMFSTNSVYSSNASCGFVGICRFSSSITILAKSRNSCTAGWGFSHVSCWHRWKSWSSHCWEYSSCPACMTIIIARHKICTPALYIFTAYFWQKVKFIRYPIVAIDSCSDAMGIPSIHCSIEISLNYVHECKSQAISKKRAIKLCECLAQTCKYTFELGRSHQSVLHPLESIVTKK